MNTEILRGDCLEVMASMPEESVEAIVTDPPYGLGFMGKKWDELPPGPEFAAAALRVLKPGGHLLAFGGTRTYHRLTVALEDAGFEIRDCLSWLYGSGFPKSHNVSKAIDKAAGAEREVVGQYEVTRDLSGGSWAELHGKTNAAKQHDITAPATEDAARWEGFGTALKPSWEPIIMARKPLTGTVASNVLAHGTGALNIDGCRVGDNPGYSYPNGPGGNTYTVGEGPDGSRTEPVASTLGRWPANTVLDEQAAAILDAEVGERTSGTGAVRRQAPGQFGLGGDGKPNVEYGDTGGPSRFFYVAKASRKERNAGLEGFKEVAAKRTQDGGDDTRGRPIPLNRNTHPTVKPINLMRWLVRMVTPPGGTILDPFTGSGTTGCAAALEGFDFIGIEREAEYADIAEARIEHWSKHG